MSPKKSTPPKEPFVSQIDRPQGVHHINPDAMLTELRARDLAMILHDPDFVVFRKPRPDNRPLDPGTALTELRARDLAMILHSREELEFPFRKPRPDNLPSPEPPPPST